MSNYTVFQIYEALDKSVALHKPAFNGLSIDAEVDFENNILMVEPLVHNEGLYMLSNDLEKEIEFIEIISLEDLEEKIKNYFNHLEEIYFSEVVNEYKEGAVLVTNISSGFTTSFVNKEDLGID